METTRDDSGTTKDVLAPSRLNTYLGRIFFRPCLNWQVLQIQYYLENRPWESDAGGTVG
jgi:hypothetical protein